MLHVRARIERQFELPVSMRVAQAHLRHFRQTLQDLPELIVTAELGPDHYRVRYGTTVGGVYQVQIFTDIAVRYDEREHALIITPLEGHAPVSGSVSVRGLTSQGRYASRLALSGSGKTTRAHYALDISADLPKPRRLSLVPNALAALVVEQVMQNRAEASTDAFISRTRQRLAESAGTAVD